MGINTYFSQGNRLLASTFGPFVDGINETVEPHLLNAKEFSSAENLDIDTAIGRVSKRPGLLKAGSFSGLLEFAPKNAFTYIQNGKELLIVSDGKYVLKSEDAVTFVRLKIYDDTDLIMNIDGFPRFEQGHNKLWITNKIEDVISFGIDDAHVVKHGRQLISSIPNDAVGDLPFSTFVYTGVEAITANEFKDKILSIGLKFSDGKSTTGATGQYAMVSGNTAKSEGAGSAEFFLNATITPESGQKMRNSTVYIGVNIPKCSYIKFYAETMFLGDTENNLLEIRFSELTNPDNPFYNINADHPRAWPAVNQLFAQAGIGDRIYGFSPTYRNRFAVFKEIGIFRIDPDPTFKFTLENFSDEIGSRFPDTWVEINGVLKFLGSRRDSKPDIFYTDFVSIGDYDRKHHKTLDDLKQPKQMIKSHITDGQSAWDNATKSTLINTNNGMLQIGKIASKTEWEASIVSRENIDLESNAGIISVLGTPKWELRYEGDNLPESELDAWTSDSTGNISDGANGEYKIYTLANYAHQPFTGFKFHYYNGLKVLKRDLIESGNVYARFRAKANNSGNAVFGIWNNGYGIWYQILAPDEEHPFLTGLIATSLRRYNSGFSLSGSNTTYHNYNLLLKTDGEFKLWRDGNYGR